MLDVVQTRNADTMIGLVEDITIFAPEFYSIPTQTRTGMDYYICKRTAYPPVQFRTVNNGVVAGKSQYHRELREMFFMDAPINVDEAVVQQDDGAIGTFLANEALGVLKSAVIYIGNQFYYGAGVNPGGTAVATLTSDANGFVGIRQQIAGSITAGGSTNTSSAYLVWLAPWGVHFDIGKDGMFGMKPWSQQQIPNPVAGGTGNLFAWVSNLSSWLGLSVISNLSVWAVTGIDFTSHKLTDALGWQLLSNIPMARRNGLVWFMNRSAHASLQAGRTVTLQGYGTNVPNQGTIAALPTNLAGFPIIVTDSILSTENNS